MSRYIDKEALLEWLEKVDGCIADRTVEAPTLYRQMITDIKNFGTEDVVEVVRCRECKHSTTYKLWNGRPYIACRYNGLISEVSADHYCSYGGRREDGT